MAHEWDDFNKFDDVMSDYLPEKGEGETLASQVSTAVSKLVYKYFNDGDVYDNRYFLNGWWNDLSSYANWLATNFRPAHVVLSRIEKAKTEEDYEDILYDLCRCFPKEYLLWLNNIPKVGSVYHCDGPFEYVELDDEEEED